jgi:hypothetical protein
MCRQPPAQQQQHPLKGLGESVQAGWDLLQCLQQMGQQQQMVRQQGRLQVVQQQLRIVAPGAAVDAGVGAVADPRVDVVGAGRVSRMLLPVQALTLLLACSMLLPFRSPRQPACNSRASTMQQSMGTTQACLPVCPGQQLVMLAVLRTGSPGPQQGWWVAWGTPHHQGLLRHTLHRHKLVAWQQRRRQQGQQLSIGLGVWLASSMQQQRLASSTQQQRLASSMHQQQQRRLASSMHQQQQRRLASLTQQQRLASLTQQQQPPPVVLCTVFRVCSMAFLARGFLAAPPGVAAANLQARKVVVSRHQGQQLVCSI